MLDTPQPGKKIRSDAIAEQLEEAVINGEIAAGARLDETSIAAQFNVSRTPVREALHILCGRGLAEREPYKGVIVTQISAERIDEMFEAMAELEATCGRLASHRMTMSERAGSRKPASGDECACRRRRSRRLQRDQYPFPQPSVPG
ncbi:GntR family transcriptional regulator (plasmid) [Neorhizobium galegae]|nr:GntR family transcriptional regulator [Neorhizobium galegae]